MISYEHECIFVHIPKTGGTSIENMIWTQSERNVRHLCQGLVDSFNNKYQSGGLQHLLSWQIREEIGVEFFDKCFKFSVVRNPWDKAVSQYEYMKEREDLRDFIGMKRNEEFRTYRELIQTKTHVQWEHQYRFVFDENGEQLVDYLGRFENFNEEVEFIMTRLGLDRGMFGFKRKIPHAKKSNRRHVSSYYDKESFEMVREYYKMDVELFNYELTYDSIVECSSMSS